MNPCKDDTRSRPHTSTPRPPCEECIYQSQSVEQIAAIRNATLDKFKEVIRMHDEDELLYPDLYNEFLVIYKSLRKEQP